MTRPTPAGWYPDPDGSGGQRYWDGDSWTEHLAPAAPANEEPTSVVQLRSVPNLPQVDPAPFDIPPSPAFGVPAAGPSNGNRSLLIGYGAACAALLMVLIGLAIYGFLIKEDPEVQLSAPDGEIVTGAPQVSSPGNWGEPTGTETPTAAAAPAAGEATDGPLSFTVNGMEIGPTVAMTDAPIEKTAVGQFIVLHMAVANLGPEPSTFIAMFQTLHAGGATYQVDDEATAYLGGTFADLPPGASQVVSIAFDVPSGTVPESIELHVDPTTPGVAVPLP